MIFLLAFVWRSIENICERKILFQKMKHALEPFLQLIRSDKAFDHTEKDFPFIQHIEFLGMCFNIWGAIFQYFGLGIFYHHITP